MANLASTLDKTIGLINTYLDLIAANTMAQTNVPDQLKTAGELASIAQILTKAQASQENYNGQEAPEETTKTQKAQAQSTNLKDIFNAANDD